VQSSVRNEQAAQKRAAEQVGQQHAAREKTRAELDAQAKVQQQPKPRSATKSIPRLKKSSTPSTII